MALYFEPEEVAKHNTEQSCWLIIHNKVYDVTKFLVDHPGGKKVILAKAGQDATKEFDELHNPAVMARHANELQIGLLGHKEEKTSPKDLLPGSSKIKYDRIAAAASAVGFKNVFGELIPFGDPAWYQDHNSPYYNETHRALRSKLRDFIDQEVMPFVHEWDEAKQLPRELFNRCAVAGFLPAACGKPWPVDFVGSAPVFGLFPPEQFDTFHELIINDEIARCGSGGVTWGLFGGLGIGLPPVVKFGSAELKQRVVRPCLMGEKIICLAITEPYAGSDVANIQCKAERTADGKHFVVNGEKKWITNGVFADMFVTAVRTGGAGMHGVSLLLLDRSMSGITTRQMKCMGVWSSGTAYVTLEDVLVPVENLIGQEGKGFKAIMANFNHERWSICVQSNRFARVCLEDALKYADKRRTFGKKLIEHPVIRQKLALMAAKVEASQAWIESLTHQLNTMSSRDQMMKLGGPIAICKAQCTQTFEFCAAEAAQIFGGLAYTRGGPGERVSRLYRDVRAMAIPGGSEEIMQELGIRQAMQYMKLMSSL